MSYNCWVPGFFFCEGSMRVFVCLLSLHDLDIYISLKDHGG